MATRPPEPFLLRFTAPGFMPAPEEPRDEAAPEADASYEDPGREERKAPDREPAPPGAELIEAIASSLRADGWHCDYQWATWRGHALDARRLKRRYDVEVWLCDPAAGRWELSAEPRRGLFKRLFAVAPDPVEHAVLRLNLEAALWRLDGVSDLSPWRDAPSESGW
jgi:hypothetical protein